MASKAFEKGFQNLKYKITGQKYHNNLLGESLEDMLRIATAKTLEAPDATTNQQVVETIDAEITAGKDPKEVVSLLKARLRMDNPQKQFLAVHLVEQVLSDCSGVLGAYQQELLQEIARVMTRPAKPETDAGKRARQAAKELLRKYGQEGTSAFRAVHNEDRMHRPQHAGQPGAPPGTAYGVYGAYPPPYGANQPPYGAYGAPGQPVYPGGAPPGMNIETQSLIDEVRLLIDKARSNTELLSDMLVSSSGAPDDFETELVKDLATEVRELRDLFSAYLEQISTMEDPQMEVLLVQALEAVDMLDGAIALQKDVALNQQEFAAASATSPRDTSPAPSPVPATAAAAAPAPAPETNSDLIALDELSDALTATQAAASSSGAGTGSGTGPSGARQQPYDPFAASDFVPILGSPPPAAPASSGNPAAPPAAHAAPPQPQPQPAHMQSAFETMFNQPGGSEAYATFAAQAPNYTGPSAPPYPGAPTPAYPGAPVPYPGGPAPHSQQPYGQGPAAAPLYGQAFGGHAAQQAYAAPPPYGHQPSPDPFAPTTQSSNPFMAGSAAGGSIFLPGPPVGSSNPFVSGAPAPIPPASSGPSVDHEWEQFFADRVAQPQASKPAGGVP